jgi:hypothetical protein
MNVINLGSHLISDLKALKSGHAPKVKEKKTSAITRPLLEETPTSNQQQDSAIKGGSSTGT